MSLALYPSRVRSNDLLGGAFIDEPRASFDSGLNGWRLARSIRPYIELAARTRLQRSHPLRPFAYCRCKVIEIAWHYIVFNGHVEVTIRPAGSTNPATEDPDPHHYWVCCRPTLDVLNVVGHLVHSRLALPRAPPNG